MKDLVLDWVEKDGRFCTSGCEIKTVAIDAGGTLTIELIVGKPNTMPWPRSPAQGGPNDECWRPEQSGATSKILSAVSRFIDKHGAYLQRRSLWAACCHSFSVGYRRGYAAGKAGRQL